MRRYFLEQMSKLIHVAYKIGGHGRKQWLFLRELSHDCYSWFTEDGKKTDVAAVSIDRAIRFAWEKWKDQGLHMLMCGFKYTLPERDEHGMNALYHEMVASYSTPNGIYFDGKAGFNCIVQNASLEALSFWRDNGDAKILV
jgi:hypothetical protein